MFAPSPSLIVKDRLEKGSFSAVVKNFLKLLIEKNRIGALPAINDYYARLTDELSNITRAEIIAARPLNEGARSKLIGALRSFTSKDVRAEVKADESLIGGVVVRIGDLVLDGSIRAQLEGLKESLKRGEYS